MTYKIEKSIPIPRIGGGTQYPFKNMEIGDSFLFGRKEKSKVYSAAKYHSRVMGLKFLTRKISETEYRIWRVK